MEFEVEVEVPQYPQHHAGLLFYKIHFFLFYSGAGYVVWGGMLMNNKNLTAFFPN